MARGRSRRVALDIVPMAMERLEYYAQYEQRTNKGLDEDLPDGGWNTPQIVNYVNLITDIFKAVPETKSLSNSLSKVFVMWFKDPTTIGVHMLHIRNLVDPRPRVKWEKTFDKCDWDQLFWMDERQLKKYNEKIEDEEEEEEDEEEDAAQPQKIVHYFVYIRIATLDE